MSPVLVVSGYTGIPLFCCVQDRSRHYLWPSARLCTRSLPRRCGIAYGPGSPYTLHTSVDRTPVRNRRSHQREAIQKSPPRPQLLTYSMLLSQRGTFTLLPREGLRGVRGPCITSHSSAGLKGDQ